MRKSFVYSLYAVAIPFLWCFSPPVHAGGITENFRDAVFEDYQPGQKVAVNLGSKSAQYVFSGGISKFHGLKLSERAPNNLLEVVTVRRGWWLPTADVLVPAFLFLNSEFEEIGTSPISIHGET